MPHPNRKNRRRMGRWYIGAGQRVLPDFQHDWVVATYFQVPGFDSGKEENTGYLLDPGNVTALGQFEFLHLCIGDLQFVFTVNVEIVRVIGVILENNVRTTWVFCACCETDGKHGENQKGQLFHSKKGLEVRVIKMDYN